jgi:SAM-dependent methyltransferase
MLLNLPERARLVCPVCRAGGLRVEVAVPAGAGAVRHGMLHCGSPTCRAARPIIDAVPILVEDWLAYARSERWIILRRQDLPPAAGEMLDAPLGDDHAERIRQRHLETYRRSHFGPFSPETVGLNREFAGFLEAAFSRYAIPANGGPVCALDAGCATGGYTQMLSGRVDLAIGIDFHFERIRAAVEECPAASNAAFLVADAEDPPFEPASFDIVLALNLLDAVSLPRRALESLTLCLRPGGLLFLTTPFEYSTTYSERKEWISEPELIPMLAGDLEILEDRERLPWVLPVSSRRSDVFFVRALVARKRRSGTS